MRLICENNGIEQTIAIGDRYDLLRTLEVKVEQHKQAGFKVNFIDDDYVKIWGGGMVKWLIIAE